MSREVMELAWDLIQEAENKSGEEVWKSKLRMVGSGANKEKGEL